MEIKEQGENENFSEIRNILEVVKKKVKQRNDNINLGFTWTGHTDWQPKTSLKDAKSILVIFNFAELVAEILVGRVIGS